MSEERLRRRTLLLRPSKRGGGALGSSSRRRFSLGGGSKVLERSAFQVQKQPVQVLDEEHKDVIPQPLYQVDLRAAEAKTSRFLVDEISAGSTSDQLTATGSLVMPFSRSVFGSSRMSSYSTMESLNEEMEEAFSKRDTLSFLLPDEKRTKTTEKEEVTEDMLMETVDVSIAESDSVSLIDIPSRSASADSDVAEAIIERNNQYAEVCKNRINIDKYVDQSVQTLKGLTKNKQIQRGGVAAADTATAVSTSDMFDDLVQENTVDRPEARKTGSDEAVIDSSCAERSLSFGSSGSTVGASSSMKEVNAFGKMLNTQSDLQLITTSEKFQHSLLVMERSVMRDSFHPQLAAYRQLPLLKDPDKLLKTEEEEQSKKESERPPCGALRRLWVYSCELSRGCRVSSMAWNRKNPDLLAVGYGELDSRNQKPGLVCCWSLKNPKWPDCIIHCDSAVTCLDFSASSPSQLAVGMCDGTIAIYNVHSADFNSCAASSRESPNRHIGPVWQLRWIQQELNLTGEKLETLFSVGADGRIKKWFVFNGGLDCTDAMQVKKIHRTDRKDGVNKTGKTTESVLSALTPALCFDFYPAESSIYLTGTWEGLIHKCSCSNSQQFLETYEKHFCPVNRVSWCPLSPDTFLSCSSDWTMQLWREDSLSPVLGFTSTHGPVCDIRWSPKRAAVFGAVNEGQLEIWDLNSSFLSPVIVQPTAPGVKMSSLLFASHTDCVVGGDADGQVTVYQLENLSAGENSQVGVLDDLLSSEECLPRQFGTAQSLDHL